MLYQSKALENYNKSEIRIYHGKISESIVEKNDDVFNMNYDFKKFNNMGLYFKGEVAFSENEINQIKTEIEPYKDSIIAVCDFDSKRKYSEEYHLKCFFKEFMNVEEYMTKWHYKLENAKEIMESVCNNRLKGIYGQKIPN